MQDKSDPGHGNTVASWTTVIILMIATAIGAVFFFLDMPAIVWAATALALAGLVVGYILRKRGFGALGSATESN